MNVLFIYTAVEVFLYLLEIFLWVYNFDWQLFDAALKVYGTDWSEIVSKVKFDVTWSNTNLKDRHRTLKQKLLKEKLLEQKLLKKKWLEQKLLNEKANMP